MIALSRRLAIGVAAAAAVACGDIASPERTDLYEWRLFAPASGGGTDTLSFHWPRARLPVRIWAEDVNGMPAYTDRAIEAWESVFLYREFQGIRVGDSATADVLIRGAPPANVSAAVTRLASALAPQCSGATDLDVSEDHTELRLPVRVFIAPNVPTDDPATQTCLALTTIHELGHALGIFAHSPNPSDIMYANPLVELPSQLDRGTIEAIYHYPPTLEPLRP